jgi:hypothetical protein
MRGRFIAGSVGTPPPLTARTRRFPFFFAKKPALARAALDGRRSRSIRRPFYAGPISRAKFHARLLRYFDELSENY